MKKLILLVWVMLILSLLAFSAFADTVPPAGANCKMYYDENGTAYYPESCLYECSHPPRVGDTYVDDKGNIIGVVTDVFPDYNASGKIIGYFVASEEYPPESIGIQSDTIN